MNAQKHSFEKDSTDLIFYNTESIELYLEGNYKKGLEYTKKEVSLLEKYKTKNKKYTKALYKLAYFYTLVDSLDKGLEFHQKVINLNIDIIQTGKSYCEIGNIYGELGELNKSLDFYQKGITILEKNDDSDIVFNKYINFTFTIFNSATHKYDSLGIKYLEKAEQIAKKYNYSKDEYYDLYNQFAVLYSKVSLYDFKKIKNYNIKNIKNSNGDAIKLARVYNNLASLYVNEKKDSSEYFIKKGLNYSSKNITRARLYDNYSDFYFYKNNFKNSLKSIDKAIEINIKKNTDEEFILNETDFNKSLDKTHLIHCLHRKSKILNALYRKENDIDFLNKVIENVKTTDKLVQFILQEMSEQKTKLHWIKEASQAYFYGIQASYLLNDNSTAFSFMEKNKALLLIESISKNKENSRLPKNIIQQNNQLKSSILKLENLSRNNNQNSLLDSLFTIKQVYEKFKDSLKISYPEYFRNKLNLEEVPLSEVQEKLIKNEVVVSYAWNHNDAKNEAIYGQLISQDKTEFFKILDVDNLKNTLKEYIKFISKPFETKEQEVAFKTVSHNLYKQVFPTQNIREYLNNKSITIIPEGELHNIPFDALITKENTFDYLLHSNSISYAYSMSFLKQNKKVKRATENDFIGYSPVDFNNQKLENLNNTKTEVLAIQNKIGGTTLLNDKAKKNHFLSKSNTSKIIHLATHADATNNPWIAFADEKLELHELYTYKNNADLVVLSACNTSLGELIQGEGVLSLARGFFYSGAKSVVSSLWNVNDKSTSSIMTEFYKNLKAGETKSMALTNAKRNYLKTHTLSEKSPYYWSSFVLIGDSNIIELSNNNWVYYILFAILIISLFIFFKKK